MPPYAQGVAKVRHAETNVVYEVDADELEWTTEIEEERDMGTELAHCAVVEHEELGTLTWTVWEYPPGVENDRDTEVGDHTVVQNFTFGFEDDGGD